MTVLRRLAASSLVLTLAAGFASAGLPVATRDVAPQGRVVTIRADVGAMRRDGPGLALTAMLRDGEVRGFVLRSAGRAVPGLALDVGALRGLAAAARMFGLPALLDGEILLSYAPASSSVEPPDVLLVAETTGREAALEALARAFEEIALDWEVLASDPPSADPLRRRVRYRLAGGRSFALDLGAVGDVVVAATRPDTFDRAVERLARAEGEVGAQGGIWVGLDVEGDALAGTPMRRLRYELSAEGSDLVEDLAVETVVPLGPSGGVAAGGSGLRPGLDLLVARGAFDPSLLEPLLGDASGALEGRVLARLRRAGATGGLPVLEASVAVSDASLLAGVLPGVLAARARRSGAPPPRSAEVAGALAAGVFAPGGPLAGLGPVRYAVGPDSLWLSTAPSFPPPAARAAPPPPGDAWFVLDADLATCVEDLWGFFETAARLPGSPLYGAFDAASLPIAEDVASHLGTYRLEVRASGSAVRVRAKSAVGGPLLLFTAAAIWAAGGAPEPWSAGARSR